MGKKLWSMSTTVRNPYRIKGFLHVLNQIEGKIWNKETQSQFQILLIQQRLYKPESQYLTSEQIDLWNSSEEMTFDQAKDIFDSRNYEDPPMRGRTSYKPLEKAGLAFIINHKVMITDLGKKLLSGIIDIDDFWFRSLINWQYPNPLSRDYLQSDGYDTKPFISTLLLINRVNQLCKKRNISAKGISKKEFGIFALSLINYKDINSTAEKLLEFRTQYEELSSVKKHEEQSNFVIQYTRQYLSDYENYNEQNIRDYTDNAIRYFRLTKYISIRGGGYFIDLEPRRTIELKKLFKTENGSSKKFNSKKDFIEFMCASSTYDLPWENVSEMQLIANQILKDIRLLQPNFTFMPLENTVENLNHQIAKLREIRSSLQSERQIYDENAIEDTIKKLENIRKLPEKPSIALEKYVYRAMKILNDATEIKMNAPLGDDNEPTFTAPANVPDLECFYSDFCCICEVTMLTGREQWYNEGQPVMRHLRNFELKHPEKTGYCLFISPSLHNDTKNTFWIAIKYEYEGIKQRIIPFTISQIVYILKVILTLRKNNKPFYHSQLRTLYDNILHISNMNNSSGWAKNIQSVLEEWAREIQMS
ncbi:MAG: AlwI family type II restriction endonuclease [Planctomycetia bacterium]|nr:AlwI family type II restriction endonuclease [Planctomycetia bacterium]